MGALKADATKAVVSLLECGVDLNGLLLCRNRSNARRDKSPLYKALGSLSSKKYTHVGLLLQYKANINAEDLLPYILGFDYDACLLRLLVEAGFDLDKYGPKGLELAI